MRNFSVEQLPDFFFDKELCDAYRDIIVNSVADFDDVKEYLSFSNNYKRDSRIIKVLANVGAGSEIILKAIKAINADPNIYE